MLLGFGLQTSSGRAVVPTKVAIHAAASRKRGQTSPVHHLGRTDRQQLLAEASAGEAIGQVDQPVDDEEPHACEVPVEAPGCPIAKSPEGTEMEPTDDYVIIVDTPTRRNHDHHD